MNGRHSRVTHQIAEHAHYFKKDSAKSKKNSAQSKSVHQSYRKSADIIHLKADNLEDNSDKYRPNLPKSLRFGEYNEQQIPFIEGLGWMLVYLLRRYPELKETQGFQYAHISGAEHHLRKGFYEAHAFFTIDVGIPNLIDVQNQGQGITIDVAYGRLEAEKLCWTVEVFSGGGLVRKFVCDTQDQVIIKLNEQLQKYGLIQQAWHQSQRTH